MGTSWTNLSLDHGAPAHLRCSIENGGAHRYIPQRAPDKQQTVQDHMHSRCTDKRIKASEPHGPLAVLFGDMKIKQIECFEHACTHFLYI